MVFLLLHTYILLRVHQSCNILRKTKSHQIRLPMGIQWNIPKEDVPLIESKDEEYGLFIICKCCLQYPLIALDSNRKKIGKKEPWRVNVRIGRPFTLGTWNEHKIAKGHIRAENVSNDPQKQQHVIKGSLPSVTTFFTEKRKDNSTSSKKQQHVIQGSLPSVTTFFTEKRKDNSTSSNPSMMKKKKMDLPEHKPFYKLHCNGVVPTAQLLNKNKSNEHERNAHVQNGLRVQKRMFVTGFVGCDIGVLPGSEEEELLTLYSTGCVREKIGRLNHEKVGVRCASCEAVRKSKWTKKGLRDMVISRGKKWGFAVSMLEGTAIDVSQEATQQDVKKIIQTPTRILSADGKLIISQMKSLMMLQSSKAKGMNGSSSSIYVKEFIKFFDANPNFRNSLLGQLVEVTMKRTSGYTTSAIPERLMDFFCLIHMYDPKTAQLISANFLGPSGRSMINHLKKTVTPASQVQFITRTRECLKKTMQHRINSLFPDKGTRVAFSAAIDAVKVAKLRQIDFRYNAILGGAFKPIDNTLFGGWGNHFISGAMDSGQTLKDKLQDESIIMADELKVIVVTFQSTNNQSPYLILAGRPQTTNENSLFNEICCEVLQEVAVEMSKERDSHVVFTGNSNDGVSCDKDFVVKTLSGFLRGEHPYSASSDIKHNAKNMRTQIVGFSRVKTIGSYMIDAGVLRVSNVVIDLWRITDWASDALVLKLASASTCKKILFSDVSDLPTRMTLAATLLFLRAHLMAIDCKYDLDNIARVKLLWASLIFFLHMDGVSVITKRNWIMAAIANSFWLMMTDVGEPEKVQSEPCEHVFGHARSFVREFTVRDFCNIVTKISKRFDFIHKNNFQQHRDPQKGYLSQSHLAVKHKANRTGGPVDIFADRIGEQSVADCIWKELMPHLNEVNAMMTVFLSRVFQVKSYHILTKQFKSFKNNAPTDLLDDFLTCMRKGETHHFFKKADDNVQEELNVGHESLNENNRNADTGVPDGESDVEHGSDNENDRNADMVVPDGEALTEARKEQIFEETKKCATMGSEYDEAEHDPALVETRETDVENANSNSAKFEDSWSSMEKLIKSDDFESIQSEILHCFQCMQVTEGDLGAVSNSQRFKSLTQRYQCKTEVKDGAEKKLPAKDAKKSSTDGFMIERGRIVKISGYEGRYFVVTDVGNKFYNKWFCVNKETDRPNWPPASTKGKIKDNHIHVREIVQHKKLGFFVFKPYTEVVESRVVKDKAKSYIEIQDLRSIVQVGEMMQA